jgi:hypothetical protein
MFFKKMKKDIAEIKAMLANGLVEKAEKADEQDEYLACIKLKVKSISQMPLENGKIGVKIIYDAPQIVLEYDDSGEVMVNSTFRAINGLDLISMEDKIRIARFLNSQNKKD